MTTNLVHTIVTASDMTSVFDEQEWDVSVQTSNSLDLKFLVFRKARKIIRRPDGSEEWVPLSGQEQSSISSFPISQILEYHLDGEHEMLRKYRSELIP